MGFLSSMIKKGIGEGLSQGISKGLSSAFEKAVESAVKPAAENLANAAADNINQAAGNLEEAAGAQKEYKSSFEEAMANLEKAAKNYNNAAEQMEKKCSSCDNVKKPAAPTGTAEYFAAIIRENIEGVEVRQDVAASEIGAAPEKAVKIDVLIVKDAKPRAAVILVPKNSYRTVGVMNTMDLCEENGVKALRFMQEFANEPAYVVDRIKAAL